MAEKVCFSETASPVLSREGHVQVQRCWPPGQAKPRASHAGGRRAVAPWGQAPEGPG